MRRAAQRAISALAGLVLACSGGEPGGKSAANSAGDDAGQLVDAAVDDASQVDATVIAPSIDAGEDGGDAAGDDGGCEWGGAPGQCMTLPACAALPNHSSFADECPGPATIECCIVTPSTADNPPTPAGYVLMQQSQVTAAMTAWAVAILDDPTDYPMFSTTTKVFGTLTVLARVEWHPPDFQNSVVHRGVTLYEPSD
jgi:hypothetical protein